MMRVDEIAAHFDHVEENNGGYLADCPICHTHHLFITEKGNKTLLYCQHGTCQSKVSAAEICSAVGLTMKDLYNDSGLEPLQHKPAAAPEKPKYHYKSIPQRKSFNKGPKIPLERTHEYRDQDGQILGIKTIYRNPETKDKEVWWFSHDADGYTSGLGGRKMPFYHLPELMHSDPAVPVYVVEGEKDCDTLQKLGRVAVSAPNGGNQSKWLPLFNTGLSGRDLIVIMDNDHTGRRYGGFIHHHAAPIAKSVRLIPSESLCPDLPEKGDITDVVDLIGGQAAMEALDRVTAQTEAVAAPVDLIPAGSVEAEGRKVSWSATPADRLTIEALEDELQIRGYRVRHNVIANAIEVTGYNQKESAEHIVANLPILLYSELCNDYKGCSTQTIAEYLRVIATRNCFNPVLDLMEANKWDGTDHLTMLYDALGIDERDQLSRVLILKWLWQGLALLRNDPAEPFGADGILTLAGPQGTGKTSTFAKLAILPKFFRGGQRLSDHDKDCQRRCVTTWICELGEVDATLRKSDAGALKGFITCEYDEYRLPYGRTDQQNPRRTNLCATVNPDQASGQLQFLVDDTGNRRFWVVPVYKIDLQKLRSLDALQIWLQVWEQHARYNLQGFRLTEEERQQLAIRNGACEKPLKGEDEVLDILQEAAQSSSYEMRYASVSDFRIEHTSLDRYSVAQIGKVLSKLGYPESRRRVPNKNGICTVSRVRELPMRVFSNKYHSE